ncbi:palmitoyltransferase akr1 [Ophidiomyces ophidiicola]|uniref:palmitoyltransferase akr1 n=1 Tax=Ophidiomyces ophidiicola TaxID=1387563 RepID=UPI0020C2074F|nr:palmitoyltransferase akr1 [Ophidiomyces ophidiicola]KAI1916247.1 palmitoyltransferase akr1 [Ophidiomyces ophidiicola]KAI1938318.1 palmitoyltransferase akr1 [Ophidiomyces ophidiicola]KAI2016260.1 palmitoyltransferase akr1 [Ophidiomyces ophidiicola]KAI2051205.1 palmitoyltransferase akr1 [Ophidiomyces ophidiicola]KAI2142041.1 palmitoyltransferase akr1 [Ophidiomyces ophidiicola]
MPALPPKQESRGPNDQGSATSSSSSNDSDVSLQHMLREDGVELKDVNPSNRSTGVPPIEEDIMQLARLGEIGAIKKLFDKGKYDVKYRDEEDITPLHWAAINNRYELCKFLLDSGADANAKGGESVATPAMWAAQRCHYYIVNLLLQYGADPLLTDAQGYNILHLATIDGNAFLLVLLLHQDIPVDVADPQGHTGLMWAAYKGFPACVDLFLRWGANVNAADEGGLTPLHWALVKGSAPCIYKILEYGADRYAKTRDGKTPGTVAEEMKTVSAWHRALSESGYQPNGDVTHLPLGLAPILRTRRYVSKFFFLWPFTIIYIAIWILSEFSIFISIPLVLICIFGMQWVAQWVASRSISDFRLIQRTPFLAGVFAGSLFWVGVQWLSRVLPYTYSSFPLYNFSFAIFATLTGYFYFLSMLEDPGFVPKVSSRNQQKTTVMDLLGIWKFDDDNFCVFCLIRKPLRSKHCRRCKRCVSKYDHHCPWIDNCVGSNNLRHFVLYIFALEIGITLFIRLIFAYIDTLPTPSGTECNIISPSLCGIIKRDAFTILLTVWTALQLVWVTMLCVVQLVQISRNQTTHENMKGHSIEYADPATGAVTSAILTGGVSAAPGASSLPTSSGQKQHSHRHGGYFSQWKTLLGLDTFMATAQEGLRDRRAARYRNPFSYGIATNCRDFWCDPAPYFRRRDPGSAMLNGELVNYNRMYETPLRLRTGESGMVYRGVATDDIETQV